MFLNFLDNRVKNMYFLSRGCRLDAAVAYFYVPFIDCFATLFTTCICRSQARVSDLDC